MPRLPPLIPLLLAAPVALAQPPPAGQPRPIGSFGAWTAAVHGEGAGRICYALTRATRSEGVPGRRAVLLTVTHRAGGRDAVVISAGYTFPRLAEATVAVGGTELAFYTAGQSAAPRDALAAIRAFRGGQTALLRAPGPNGRGQAADTFTLAGFAPAHDAISRACPATGVRR